MTDDQWVFQMARMVAFWPAADKWGPRTVSAYFDMLEDIPVENVADAITALMGEGLTTPPNGGKILRKVREGAPKLGVKVSDACVCADSIGNYKQCTAGHPEGWIDNRRDEESAREIIDKAKAAGTRVNPHDHGDIREILEGMMLGDFYAANRRAGRAIDDPGDADGNPTIFAPKAKRSIAKFGTPGEQEEPQMLAELLAMNRIVDQAKRHSRSL